MDDWYPLLAIAIELALFLLALLWLGAPLIVRATMTQPVEPRFDLIPEATWESLPGTVRERLEAAEAGLDALGFRPVARLQQVGQVPNVDAYLTLLKQERCEDWAAGTVLVAGPRKQEHHYVEFSTSFEGDSSLDTSNSTELSPFDPPPRKTVMPVPGELDLARLYRVHRAVVERRRGDVPKVVAPESAIDHLEESVARDLRDQADRGLFVRDPGSHDWRPTLVGAYRMTWRLLWPVAPVRRWLARRRARRFVEEVGAAR